MAGGPSPNSTSPSSLSNSAFLHGSFSSTSSSPPKQSFSAKNTMTADVFSPSHSYGYVPMPIGERRARDKSDMPSLFPSEAESTSDPKGPPAIFLRKLPSNSDRDAVRNILLFAKDLIDCELVSTSKYPEDKGFASAVARFRSLEGAKEARDLLHGKRTGSSDASLIVELVQDGIPGAIGSRRNTVDSIAMRQGSVSTPTGISANVPTARQSSRYNGTFQNMEKISPPNGTPGLGNGEFPVQNLFSPTSPVSTTFNHRNLGKSVINDEADDEEGLLQESFGYAAGGQPGQNTMPRRQTQASIPLSRFSALSLNTNGVNSMSSPPMPNYASPRSAATIQSPSNSMSAMSPHTMPPAMSSIGPNASYQQFNQYYPKHNYPPVNPADQNPPCNTLYVGNLPIDTSEDELKAMFSKQRGYKRLCFRTKHNGPMCFVEFEDVSFATKALSDLYGQPLHNSVKGGIRLSFSKNPLGVRTGQPPSMGPASTMAPTTTMSGFGAGVAAPPGFTTATGPPPGLVPPGLSTPAHANGTSGFSVYSNGGFGMSTNDMASPIRNHPATNGSQNGYTGMNGGMNGGGVNGSMNGSMNASMNGSMNGGANGSFPSYMMGR
ncbi:RNA binding protein-like protein [Delitschia confertaspora ATCC 74209]|uniref:RNA binding protein-like protein n=1 Tax=Delitschia confertaspora ATCC 74209 TaxID=1513339 RepID=A0A9P4MS65_9PLEO|nr:RNA binding protein-like protein [Delitschia confertaspora ATCC 74209]